MSIGEAELRDMFAHRRLVADGATGTELERRGVTCERPLWSAAAVFEQPAAVEAIHAEYVQAGADILTANTFRTSPRTLERAGKLEDGPAINKLAVELARRAAGSGGDRRVLVAASVGPVEDCYKPELAPDEATLLAEHRQMMSWLADAAPDLVWIETLNVVRECRAAAQAAKEHGLPLVMSFVAAEEGTLLGGEPLQEAVAAVRELSPVCLGLNCIPPAGITRLLPSLRALSPVPVAVYAHINNPRPLREWSFSSYVTPTDYAAHARQWFEAGATVVGGCCGTTPAHIAAVRDVASRWG